MQTVPLEFVVQLRPLMFVAGLPSPSHKVSNTADGIIAVPAQNAPGVNGEPLLVEQQSQAKSTRASTEAFVELTDTLASILSTHRSSAIFEPGLGKADAESRARFNVVLVDKNIRFPPRKVRSQNVSTATHSPISPFTPSSPLFPDGIMAPIWLRKHRELVPSVFILVLRLYEFAPGMVVADAALRDDAQVGPLEKEKLERFRDNELVNDILNRKRTCSERGIKLAVVLLASRQMLDDPSLDTRLSHIRRMSTLDSRASLFVISPVPVNEVQQFVASLLGELSDACLDYYREHGRRLRRKRSRSANSVGITGSQILSADGSSVLNGFPADERLPLSIQALNVRYEYKSAAFAEFRNEQQVALKAYEDCYMALVELFMAAYSDKPSAATSSGAMPVTGATQLRARTKRWAEARMLADCISVKICKLYLYTQNQAYAMSQYNTHLRQFQRLSQMYWGMGNDSFEYWSWASKQHRMFADLVELAVANGHGPVIAMTAPLGRSVSRQLHYGPALVMQHPGLYFIMAGLCSIRRHNAFKAAFNALAQRDASQEEPAALRHERNVLHAEQIIELFTKAYEHFKRAASTRLTLDVANRISAVYYSSGNAAAVLRFDDRIQGAYRKHRWKFILATILSRSDAAVQLNHNDREGLSEQAARVKESSIRTERIIKVFLERMALRRMRPGSSSATFDWQRLLSIVARVSDDVHTIPAISDSELSLPLECDCVFWKAQAHLLSATGTQSMVPFQLHVRSCDFQDLPGMVSITSITATFDGLSDILVIRHAAGTPLNASEIARQDLRRSFDDQLADLVSSWPLFCFEGVIGSAVATSVCLKEVTLRMRMANQDLELHCQPNGGRLVSRWQATHAPSRGLIRLPMHDLADHSKCRFEPRKLEITFEVPPTSNAYLDERYAIQCRIINNDRLAVKVILDALLHPLAYAPTGGGGDSDSIELDGHEQQRASISGAVCIDNLLPNTHHSFKLHVTGRSIPAARHLDLSIIVQPADMKVADVAVTEVSHHITVDITHPLFCDYRTAWQRCNALSSRLYDPKNILCEKNDNQQSLDSSVFCALEVTVGALGPTDLRLKTITLETTASSGAVEMLQSSIASQDGQLPADLLPEEAFLAIFQLQLPQTFDFGAGELQNMLLVVEWERISSGQCDLTRHKTSIPVSPFSRPLGFCNTKDQLQPFIAFEAPASANLHEAFDVSYYWVQPAGLFSQDINQPGPARPAHISWQVESASDDFVFSGPRKVEHKLIVPMTETPGVEVVQKLASFTYLPVGRTGLLRLPRFTAKHFLNSPAVEQNIRQACEEQGEAYPGPHQQSLPVYAGHSTLYGPSAGEEATLDSAVMLPSDAVAVYILPR